MDLDNLVIVVAVLSLFIANFKRCSSSPSRSLSKSDASKNYLTLVFWHSVFITASTPLLRLMYNRWYAHTPLHWLFSSGPSEMLGANATTCASDSLPSSFPYPTLVQSPGIDRAFFLHSMFGLTWLIVGHITLVYSHRWSATAHRRMGYAALFSFATHMGVAVYTLWADVARHHPLPRIMLMLNPVMSSRFMLGAIAAAKRGDVKVHRNLMLRVYLYSTEGAGTIRQVEHLMWMLRSGPGLCQSRNNSFATHCVWPYVVRLIMTRMLTQYHLACISRLQKDEKLYCSVVREVRGFVFAAGGLCLATWVIGLDSMGQFLQNWGYELFVLYEACLPKPGVENLPGMHRYIMF